jgi:hypothetical protein
MERTDHLPQLAARLLRAWWSARAVVVHDGPLWYRAERPQHDGGVYVLTYREAAQIVQG